MHLISGCSERVTTTCVFQVNRTPISQVFAASAVVDIQRSYRLHVQYSALWSRSEKILVKCVTL